MRIGARRILSLCVLVAGCCLSVEHSRLCAQDDAWTYIVPAEGNPFAHPPFRALSLYDQQPDDVQANVIFKGTVQRYSQLRYGLPGSVRVTVVVDVNGSEVAGIYVDTNRDRKLVVAERLHGPGPIWQVDLNAETDPRSSAKGPSRRVLFRCGIGGRLLSYCTAGFAEGKVVVGDRHVSARRVDGDGNGLFSDGQDRIWLNVDGDDRWNVRREQFLFAPVIAIGNQRYAVRGDRSGEQLALSTLTGSGKIVLAIKSDGVDEPIDKATSASPEVLELEATLAGQDGSVFAIRAEADGVEVPTGEYRIASVAMTLSDSSGGPVWRYVFSAPDGLSNYRWYPVASDRTTILDPASDVDFMLEFSEDRQLVAPGEGIMMRPMLTTVDGLILNSCVRGRKADARNSSCAARVELYGANGGRLSVGSSGFA